MARTLRAYQHTTTGIQAADETIGITRITDALKHRRQAFIFGAGISIEYPALLPLAVNGQLPGIRDLILDAIAETAQTPVTAALLPRLKTLLLEHVLDDLHRVLGNQAFTFLTPFATDRPPNFRHHALAALAQHCNRFITVNFDTLFESALNTTARNTPHYCPEEQPDEITAYQTITHDDPRTLLLKLHGTIQTPAKLLTTVELVASGLPKHKLTAITNAIGAHDLCFLDYRDSDLDVFRGITSTTNPGFITWYEYTNDASIPTLPKSVTDYLTGKEHVIYAGDLDLLLTNILTSVGIDTAPIHQVLGITALDDLDQHQQEYADRARELHATINGVAKNELTPSAARLVLMKMSGALPAARALLDTINLDELASSAGLAAITTRLLRASRSG